MSAALALMAGGLVWYVLRGIRAGPPGWALGAAAAGLAFVPIALLIAVGDSVCVCFWKMPPYDEQAIFTVNADGTGRQRLTETEIQYGKPTWSPDGSRIAVAVFGNEYTGIYMMNPDGTDWRVIVDSVADAHAAGPSGHTGPFPEFHIPSDSHPTWSPDGTKIAFTRYLQPTKTRLYVVRKDGTQKTKLADAPTLAEDVAWSPDGSRLAFTCRHDGDHDICVVNSDGSAQVNLTTGPGYDSHPAWSPDGKRLAFHSYRDYACGIHLMNSDGSEPRLLAKSCGGYQPPWSPDGEKVAFTAVRGSATQVCVINADGTDEHALTDYTEDDMIGNLCWSRDGSRLAFWRFPRGTEYACDHADIVVMNADGSAATRVATIAVRVLGEYEWPNARTVPSGFAWSPDSQKIAFASIDTSAAVTESPKTLVTLFVFLFFSICGLVAVGSGILSLRKKGGCLAAIVSIVCGAVATALLVAWVVSCWSLGGVG